MPRSLTTPFPPLADLPGWMISTLLKIVKATGRGTVALLGYTKEAMVTLVTSE